jgi:isocitrate dehydrogenase kinase/phosphatase
MTDPLDTPPLAASEAPDGPAATAREIEAAYLGYREGFRSITRRARDRFRRREWEGAQWDAAERLLLYKHAVDEIVDALRERHTTGVDAEFRAALKREFATRTRGWADAELAGTFYNSVVRRVFAVVGVDPDAEFLDPAEHHHRALSFPDHREYPTDTVDAALVRRILDSFRLDAPFRDLEGDTDAVASRVAAHLDREHPGAAVHSVEMLRAPFYRSKAAYLVGRIRLADDIVPLVLPLLHDPEGVCVDAVLLDRDHVSGVFGFSRSYFHVEIERPRAVVAFLRSIMPLKRVDELYTAVGYHKHGKRELYHELQGLLRHPDSRFEPAPGKRGLVMIVFTLPSFNVVFKVIRDRFGPTKEGSRREVMERYRMVFLHDRVGRLADAQQFEHVSFRRGCFASEVLDELLAEAGDVTVEEDEEIVIEHLYTERRVTPLDIFLREAGPDAARAAVVEYGHAIRDLAAANIFPGDMLLKNFGVTRHGRVVFYDYDELRLLTEVRFRRMPQPRDDADEMSAEPWFHVGPDDVFPEEFLPFLLPAGPLRDAFVEHHAEILTYEFWQGMQQRQQAREVIDFFPYPQHSRLERRPTRGG